MLNSIDKCWLLIAILLSVVLDGSATDEWRVTAGGRSVPVIATPMPENCLPVPERHQYHYASFVCAEETVVTVEGPALAMPTAFRLQPGSHRVVDPAGRHGALVIAANPLDWVAPKPDDPKVRYFGPGRHHVETLELKSGETLYLAEGAWLEACVVGKGENITIAGPGVLSGACWKHRHGPNGRGLDDFNREGRLVLLSGRNIIVRDVTIYSSFGWTLVLKDVDGACVDNVKILGGRVINDDGIDICSSRNVTVRNSFIRTQDDAIAPKWWCEDLVVTNCTVWSDDANNFRIGFECDPCGKGYGMRRQRYVDLDLRYPSAVIREPHQYWAHNFIHLQAVNEQRFEDIVFENIRLPNALPGDVLLNARTQKVVPEDGISAASCFSEKAGTIDGVVLRNFTVATDGFRPNVKRWTGRGKELREEVFSGDSSGLAVYLEAMDDAHPIRNVQFENVPCVGPVTTRGAVDPIRGLCKTMYAPEDAPREVRFVNPPACARILPIRNNRPNDLTKADIEIQRLKDEGFGGLVCSVNRDPTNYLHNAESWKTFRHVIETAHEMGMTIWLYDEKGYPSGAAGGQVLEGHPEWKARAYLVSVTNALDGTVRVADVKDDYIYDGTHLSVSVSQFKFDYPNLLMREPIERFVEITHDAYARELGSALRYITSTFTDEPSLMTHWRKPMPYLCLPVSDELLADYETKFGHPLKDDILALITGEPVGQTAAIRHRYWSMVAERVAENFTGPIAEWAAKHGLFSGGHLLGEESPAMHPTIYGDFFRVLRGLSAPSCDVLTSNPPEVNVLTPLFAGSAGELNGAKRVMSEASDYHQRCFPKGDCRNVQVTARQIIGSLNRQIWGGVNTFTSYYRWNAFSADERRAINEEVGRTVTIASEGRSAADVAVLYPADTLMTGFEPKRFQTGGALARRASAAFMNSVHSIFAAGRPLMIVDNRSIVEAEISGGVLVNGSLRWRTVVLPNTVTLPIGVARQLAAFAATGGQVIVLGETPVNSEKAFPDAELSGLTAKWTRVSSVKKLAEAVARHHAPAIAVTRGSKEVMRFSHRRTEKDGDVFFVANDSPESWDGAVRIVGDPAVRVWNPRNGRFYDEAAGEIALELPPYAAVVLTSEGK